MMTENYTIKDLYDILNSIEKNMNKDWYGSSHSIGLFEGGFMRIHDRQEQTNNELERIADALEMIVSKMASENKQID